MNIFRLAGDMTHLMSIVLLLLKIRSSRNCRGISLKTQQLYGLVFICRYLDIFTNFVSLYNSLMKMIFIVATFTTIWYMAGDRVVKQTYDKEQDTFRMAFLVLPCAALALAVNHKFTFMEVTWTFSIYLEAVAILPQLVLLQRTQNIDNMTGNWIFLLGSYRALYLLNWIYRYMTEDNYRQWLVWLSGTVQTALYGDFFYYYFKSWKNNERLKLPA